MKASMLLALLMLTPGVAQAADPPSPSKNHNTRNRWIRLGFWSAEGTSQRCSSNWRIAWGSVSAGQTHKRLKYSRWC